MYVVEDDEGFRTLVEMHLERAGYRIESFHSAAEFAADMELRRPCCLLLDVYLPEMSGLELQEKLVSMRAEIPIVFISGASGVPEAVRAMKNEAFDFLEKPVEREKLINVVEKAIEADRTTMFDEHGRGMLRRAYEGLTAREKEIMSCVVAGLKNRQTAEKLGITERTIKAHRARVMEKMKAESLAALVLIAESLKLTDSGKS